MGRELEEEHAPLFSQAGKPGLHPLQPRLRVVQLAELGQSPRRLGRDDEPFWQPLAPGREDLVFRPAVERIVHLDGQELPRVRVESLETRRLPWVEYVHPV